MPTKRETWDGTRHFPYGGVTFVLEEAAQAVEAIFYNRRGDTIAHRRLMNAGDGLDRRGEEPFARFEIINPASQAVKFQYSDGSDTSSPSANITDRASRQLGTLSAAAHVPTAVDVGAASEQLLAANASRRMLIVQPSPAEGAGIWIRTDGGVAVAAPPSLFIGPGQTYAPTVPPTGQVNAISDDGTDISTTVIEA